jgi:hypothetical protein
MQNLILQHANISTFLKHYLDRRINIDVAKIYRGMKPEKELMRFACSMSRSIDPRRPRFLNEEQKAMLKTLPCIVKLEERVARRARQGKAKKHQEALKLLRNERQRQRRLLLRDVIEKYKKDQPVIDSERQLSGKVVDEDVRGALERSENMTPEHLLLIDAIMTLPETSLDKEMQRRITAINAVTRYCGVEEGTSYRSTRCGRPVGGLAKNPKAENPTTPGPDTVLERAKLSVRTEKRPQICFLCVGNLALPMSDRVKKYATVGSLSRHFRRHVTKLRTGKQIDCQICNVRGMHRMHLQNHAEVCHGTVMRVDAKASKMM